MKSRRLSALATLSAAVLVTSIALAACGDDSGSSANDARDTASSLAAAASSAVSNAQGAVSSAAGAAQSAVSSAVGAASSALAAASSSIFSGDLQGGTWVVGAGLIEGALADKRPTLEIASDGTVSGFGGCNTYNGSVTIDGNSLTFGVLATTKKACGPVDTKIESTYLAQLEKVASYSFAAGRLLLQDKDGKQVLIFDQQ
jgi:heat shock protein HslJ